MPQNNTNENSRILNNGLDSNQARPHLDDTNIHNLDSLKHALALRLTTSNIKIEDIKNILTSKCREILAQSQLSVEDLIAQMPGMTPNTAVELYRKYMGILNTAHGPTGIFATSKTLESTKRALKSIFPLISNMCQSVKVTVQRWENTIKQLSENEDSAAKRYQEEIKSLKSELVEAKSLAKNRQAEANSLKLELEKAKRTCTDTQHALKKATSEGIKLRLECNQKQDSSNQQMITQARSHDVDSQSTTKSLAESHILTRSTAPSMKSAAEQTASIDSGNASTTTPFGN
ncbi:hypothetical protein OAT84_01310 [Gammaproteobacteria bacterium]|nr:hypothetical protein [Gammaproteobacteria bacterium]